MKRKINREGKTTKVKGKFPRLEGEIFKEERDGRNHRQCYLTFSFFFFFLFLVFYVFLDFFALATDKPENHRRG
jgi:hypothetical protein